MQIKREIFGSVNVHVTFNPSEDIETYELAVMLEFLEKVRKDQGYFNTGNIKKYLYIFESSSKRHFIVKINEEDRDLCEYINQNNI